MRSAMRWAFGAMLTVAMAGCAPVEAFDGDETEGTEEARVAGTGFVYLRVRQDARRCVSPLCGGVFVSRVNYRTMRCADGVYRAECYAATIDATALNTEGQSLARDASAILRGRIVAKTYRGFGNLGQLVVTEAWRAGNAERSSELAVDLVRDNGRRCIRAPCFSLDATRVNRGEVSQLSGLSLDGIGASEDTVNAGIAALATSGVMVAGYRAPRGEALSLVAEQFWVKVGDGVRDEQYCDANDECTQTQYATLITSRDACACPNLCPTTPMNETAAAENARYYTRYCSAFRNSCPVARCMAPAPVVCRRHACVAR